MIANKKQPSNYSDEHELDDEECMAASFNLEEELTDFSSLSR
jgi:hypothetical protein